MRRGSLIALHFTRVFPRARLRWTVAAAWLLAFALMRGNEAAPGVIVQTNESLIIDVWTTEEGMPRNEVSSVLQAGDGYLWLGTPSGLVRFDGNTFKLWDGIGAGGASSGVINLFEDSQGQLWVGTANGRVLVLADGRVTDAGLPPSGGARLAAACQDPGGAVWLYLSNGQLWRMQDGSKKLFSFGKDRATDYRTVIRGREGSVWIATNWQLSTLDWRAAATAATLPIELTAPAGAKLDLLLSSQNGGYWRLAGTVEKWKPNGERPEVDFRWYSWGLSRFSAACEDKNGNLVVGTAGSGLYWYTALGESSHICSTNSALSNDYVSALHVDRDGDLWVGTDGGGLNRIKRPLFHVLEPTRGLVVRSVSSDPEGGLWIGYSGNPLTYIRDGVQRPLNLEVRTVFVDGQSRVWIGTYRPGSAALLEVQLQASPPIKGVPGFNKGFESVSAIYQDRRGWLWVGSEQGLARWDQHEWSTVTSTNGLSADGVRAIADDSAGAVWVGTEGGGLNRWQEGQWTAFHAETNGLPSENISCLLAEAGGGLWVGTEGGGLARFREGRWSHYTRADGLVSNTIGYLMEDSQGYLWIGSPAGLMRAAKQGFDDFARGATNVIACRVYGKPDGLPIRECSSGAQPAASQGQDGRFWFPTIKGLVSIDPRELKINTNPPPVAIEAVLVDGQLQPGRFSSPSSPALRVPGRREHIEIQYSGLNLRAPERTRFKYRLEGHESDWIQAGSSRVAGYTKLPPGDYRFRVTACNEDGIWNPVGATVGFVITPLLWKTRWFISTTVACLLGLISAIVYYIATQRLQRQLLHLRHQEALEKERSRIARDIHDQLGASLTQVALLGELVQADKEAPAEVEIHAQQISQTARDTTRVLDEIVWAVNPANDTLDGLMTYLCKYTQEYLTVAGLQYRIEIPSQLPATILPPDARHNIFLACKEAVTNVVRHSGATAVWVRLHVEQKAFVLEIVDNGKGAAGLDEAAARTRNGLRNMRKRMEEIGGHFSIQTGPEGGAVVRFTVPLRPQN